MMDVDEALHLIETRWPKLRGLSDGSDVLAAAHVVAGELRRLQGEHGDQRIPQEGGDYPQRRT